MDAMVRSILAGLQSGEGLIEVLPHAREQTLERGEFAGFHVLRGPRADPFHTGHNLCPNRFRRRLGMDQFPAAIVAASQPFDPAVALHAVENSHERGRFEVHSIGELGLSERTFEREETKHLALPIGDARGGQFLVDRPLIFVRGGHDPESDAVLEIVFKHGNGFRTNGKRPNEFLILDLTAS